MRYFDKLCIVIGKKQAVTNIIECKMCTYAMGYLQGIVEKEKSKEKIEEAVKKLCHHLPSKYAKKVRYMILFEN